MPRETKNDGKDGRTVTVGLDGVPYPLLSSLIDQEITPKMGKLAREGTFREMRSSLPAISSVSWSSIITGENPGTHGVFGFTEIIPGTYTLSFPNFLSLQASPFWTREGQRRRVIINVPFTYPAQELNGALISGFVAPELEKAVYPKKLLPKLKEMDYKIDADSGKAHKSKELFLEELFDVLEARIETYRWLWDKYEWDDFYLVFTGTDRLMHFFWDSFAGEGDYGEEFFAFFSRIDEALGEIYSRLEDGDLFTVISDHGFESVRSAVNLNTYLAKEGLLEVESAAEGNLNYNDLTPSTEALVLDPGRVYLHKKDRFPAGSVKEEEEERLIGELEEAFAQLRYEGEKVIEEIFHKEEIYSGKRLDRAPDLLLLEKEGFDLNGGLGKEEVFSSEPFTGKHSYPDAIFLQNRELEIEGDISVEDVLTLSGLD